MGARELQALLREIKNVRSPIQRMKLISLAWRTVQRLSPSEIKALASSLGVQGFEGILQRLGRKGDDAIAPAEVLRALEEAQGLEPSEIGGFLARLSDPANRKDLLRRGLALLDRKLATGPAGPAEPEEEEEAEQDDETQDAPPSGVDEAEGVEVVEEERGDEVEAPEDAPAAAPKPVREPIEVPPEIARRPEPRPADAVPPAPNPEPAPRPALSAAIEAAPRLLTRFRLLRRTLAEETATDADDLRSILESFPEGWPRRRALALMLRDGRPERLDDAMALIDTLEHALDRRWCVAALVGSRDLSGEDADRVAERFPFPSIVRRLRRRARSVAG